MKTLLAALLLAASMPAQAAPYFRLVNLAHPDPVAGALVAPEDLKNSAAASLLPIFTHSPVDGCLLPSIVCEEWTPLAVGASMNSGRLTLDVAPLANVLPWVQQGALALLPASWAGVRAVFTPTPPLSQPVTFSAGPVWEYQQATNKGYFRVFTGVALHW